MDFLHIVWDPTSDGLKLFGNFKIHYYSLMWMVAFILGYQIMKKVYFKTPKNVCPGVMYIIL